MTPVAADKRGDGLQAGLGKRAALSYDARHSLEPVRDEARRGLWAGRPARGVGLEPDTHPRELLIGGWVQVAIARGQVRRHFVLAGFAGENHASPSQETSIASRSAPKSTGFGTPTLNVLYVPLSAGVSGYFFTHSIRFACHARRSVWNGSR